MQNKNILISGASVAGPVLAFWLRRYGFQPTIVERAPAVRPGGYAIDFRGASLRVLERMGLVPAVQDKQTRIGAITIVDRNNRKVASMPDGFTSGELEILRGDLAAIFHEATREATEYIFDDSIAAIEESEAGVDVSFQRGGRRRFDLVVGADGLHSKVRSVVFGEEAQFVRYLGYYVSIFTIPNYLNLDHAGLYYGARGKRWASSVEAIEETRRRRSFSPANRLTMPAATAISKRRSYANTFRGRLGSTAPAGVDGSRAGLLFRFRQPGKNEPLVRGRTALLGDAAWCASPLSGMGTGMAVVGAYVLAGELAEARGDHCLAFERYETSMREFVENAKASPTGAPIGLCHGPALDSG